MQEYPQLQSESNGAMGAFLRRITELRREDADEVNELLRIRGYESGFAHATKTVTADYDAGIGDLYIEANATAATLTITLPADPVDGETHHVVKISAINVVNVSGNGKNINGAGTSSIMMQYGAAKYVYFGGSDEWRVF